MFDEQDLNRLFRYCCALCDARQDACDLLQTAMERCLRNPPGDPERRMPYAMRVIRNLRNDELRRQRVITFEPLETAPPVADERLDDLESVMVDRDELEHVWRSMTVLEREIVYLWAVEGYTTDQVASQMERPRGSVLSIVHRMRTRLREQMKKQAGGSRR